MNSGRCFLCCIVFVFHLKIKWQALLVFVFVCVFVFVYGVRLLAVCTCVSPNICIKALLTAELTCLLPANLDKYGHQAGARVIYDHETGDCYDENSHI